MGTRQRGSVRRQSYQNKKKRSYHGFFLCRQRRSPARLLFSNLPMMPRRMTGIALSLLVAGVLSLPCQAVGAAVTPMKRVAWFSSPHRGLSMGLSTGIINGKSHEIVYGDDGEKISELIWRLESVPMIGLTASIPLPLDATLSLSAWSRIGRAPAHNDDYDWASEQHPADWSHHSQSPTTLTDGEVVDAQFRVPFLKTATGGISGALGFRYDHWGWADCGGTYIYSSETGFRDQQGSFENIPGISFEQWMYAPYLGVDAHGRIGKLTLTGRCAGSLWAWANDEDHHHQRDLFFEDTFERIGYFRADLGLSYPLSAHLSCTSDLSVHTYGRTTGDTTVTGPEGTGRAHDGAGMKHTSWMGTVSLVYGF